MKNSILYSIYMNVKNMKNMIIQVRIFIVSVGGLTAKKHQKIFEGARKGLRLDLNGSYMIFT